MEKTKKEPKTATIRKGSLISAEALADILGVGKPTVKKWIKKHDIPCIVVGYRWVVDTDHLAEAIDKSRSG